MTADLLLRYHASSAASDDAVSLATASPQGTPVFFDGYAEHPAQTAQALLCVARVARTRFYVPPGMVAARIAAADPVVTAESDRLRFEAFSACCGVHARFDLLDDGLDVRSFRPGTTNVDFNPPMREALARIARRDPLRVSVGEDSVEVQTLEASVVERRVPLPERWVKGFGEVQVALADAAPLLQLGRVEAQRFIRGLPRGRAGDSTVWAEPAGAAPRLATNRRPGAVCLAAPSRLRILEPLARFASGLSAYGDPDATEPSAVAWVLALEGGRVCVTLSPERIRGFSGEGGLLFHLISGQAAADADTLRVATTSLERFSINEAAETDQLSRVRAAAALTWLGVHGHLGFDTVDRAYFHRRLPYPEDVLVTDPPRLRDARALADADAVKLAADGSAKVLSEGREYRSSVDDAGFRCSCPWVAKHGTSRGPCKHVLAVAIVRSRSVAARATAAETT
jgi:hypothetical protein